MDHNRAQGVMRGRAEGPRKAGQGFNKGCGNAVETLDQCQRKVDSTLHVSWGRVVVVRKVLQGLKRVRGMEEDQGGEEEEETDTKQYQRRIITDMKRREIKRKK